MKYLFFLSLVILCNSCADQEIDNRPNIIVMLIDDAGYADFGFMGSEDLETPNLDKLAQNGMIFSDAHVSSTVCAPSRAGLLTGRYQQRFGFECNAIEEFEGIDTSEVTIAEMLKTVNYKTAVLGKWHVGEIPIARPQQVGFDYSWSFLSGARSYFSNSKEDVEGHYKSIRENGVFTNFDGYLTDVLGDKAVEFIDKNKEDKFFMYWSPNAVHTPLEATPADMAKFDGHPRQKLAAMTWALDRAVGNIYNKLEEENLAENTLIFFLSDNGGANNNQSSNLPLKGFKGNKYEGGHRVPFFVHWPVKISRGSEFEGLTSSLDIFPTIAEVVGAQGRENAALDGISLLSNLTGQKKSSPHDILFWRKEGMAAVRDGDYKLIRVDSLGHRLYNLKKDLGEVNDLSESEALKSEDLQLKLNDWENELKNPLWIESKEWNDVTWWIHKDLYENRSVRVKSPKDMETLKLTLSL